MKLEGYKAGIYTKINDYRAFILSKINYNWSWEDSKINKLLAESSREIGELNVYTKLIHKIDTYIKMFEMVEANKSCKIGGLDEKIEDCLFYTKEENEEKLNRIEEIQNCAKAINYGVEVVKQNPKIEAHTLCDIHQILMGGKTRKRTRQN